MPLERAVQLIKAAGYREKVCTATMWIFEGEPMYWRFGVANDCERGIGMIGVRIDVMTGKVDTFGPM